MATYFFDTDGATAGFGTLTGAWDTSTALWSTSSAGTSATSAVTFTNADSANFGFAGTSATAGTATIANALTVTLNKITTANLADTQTIAATGSGAITLAGTTPSIDVGSAGGLTISAPIGGSTAWSKTGTGALTTTGAVSTSAGITVSAGTWNLNGTLTSATGVLTVSSNATLSGAASASISKAISAAAGSTVTLSGATTGALTINTRNFTLTGSATSTIPTGSTIASGAGLVGALTIGPSRTVTSGTGFSGSSSTGAAAIYQTGTSSSFNRSNTATFFLSGATGAYGHYLGTSGTLGASGSIITLEVVDGVVDFNGVSVQPLGAFRNVYTGYASQNNNAALLLYRGGTTYTHGSNGLFALNWSTTETGGFNAIAVTGASTVASFPGTSQFNGAASSHSVAVAHNSGALQVASTTRQGANIAGVHLNGGTLVVTGTHGSIAAPIPVTLFGTGNKISGGAVATGEITSVIQNVDSATFGVSSVTGGTGGAGYIGPPAVKPPTTNLSLAPVVGANWSSDGTLSGYTIYSPGAYTSSAALTPTLQTAGATTPVSAPTLTLTANSTDGAVEKVDSGTLFLTGANTYSGQTLISAGKLAIGRNGALGSILSTTVNTGSAGANGTLLLNRNDSPSYSFTITGAGGIEKASGGAGTYTTLTGNNDFTGGVTVTSGDLRVGSNTALGTGAGVVAVTSGATLSLTGGVTVSRGATIAGSGLSSVGALYNVSGNNEIQGVLDLSATSAIGSASGTLTISNTASINRNSLQLTFRGDGDVDFYPTITAIATGIDHPSGTGCVILRGTNSYTTATSVTAGLGATLGYVTDIIANTAGSFGNASSAVSLVTNAGVRYYGSGAVTFSRNVTCSTASTATTLRFESNGSGSVTHTTAPTFTSNGAKTIQVGGTGSGSNTISFLVSDPAGQTFAITKADAGKWVLNNTSNSYTGGTNANGGTLVLSIDTWGAGAKVTGTGTVSVGASGKIQTPTGTGASAQLGRHTYTNLTFAANGRIRIGG